MGFDPENLFVPECISVMEQLHIQQLLMHQRSALWVFKGDFHLIGGGLHRGHCMHYCTLCFTHPASIFQYPAGENGPTPDLLHTEW